jgi:hypothetical protein
MDSSLISIDAFCQPTRSPARNWAVINLAVSALLWRSQHLFANFMTVQGNQNFKTYGGTIGMSVKW